jgi:hypothetical protein
MKQSYFTPIIFLLTGLLALGIVAGIQQRLDLEQLALGVVIALAAAACLGLFVVFASTWTLLSYVIPTPAYDTLSPREVKLGGVLLALLLVLGIINYLVGNIERSPLFVLLILLNAVGVSAGFWFLTFCVGHVMAQHCHGFLKAILFIVLVLGTLLVMPIYWCLFVWHPRSQGRTCVKG